MKPYVKFNEQFLNTRQRSRSTRLLTARSSSKNSTVIKPRVTRRLSTYFRTEYNYPPQQLTTTPIICIVSFGGTFKTSDLTSYCKSCNVVYKAVTVHKVGGVSNAANQTINSSNYNESLENTLDIQIIQTLCPKANVHIFFGPNSIPGFKNTILAAVDYLKSQTTTAAKIISISWGIPEISLGPILCSEIDKIAQDATNITICAASGDYSNDDGTGYLSLDFPSSSPNIISCGGTSYQNSVLEHVWVNNGGVGTGGGFSNYFTKGTYQSTINVPSALNFNNSALIRNRSSPDLSMNADPNYGWTVFFNGSNVVVGGTSCCAPAFSALLGLCNKQMDTVTTLTKLYANRTAFKDITIGTNDDLGLGLYSAGTGYDQCSGLGRPIGTSILNALSR